MKLCDNCREKPAETKVKGYDCCWDCEAKAYLPPHAR